MYVVLLHGDHQQLSATHMAIFGVVSARIQIHL